MARIAGSRALAPSIARLAGLTVPRCSSEHQIAMIVTTLLLRTAAILGLLFVLTAASAASDATPKVAVVSFGLFGDQSVFESEARGAAAIVARRFEGAPVIV